MSTIVWTYYLQHRAQLRSFDLAAIEHIIRHSSERYFDTETGRTVVVGRDGKQLLMIPYEIADEIITASYRPHHHPPANPVSVTNRQIYGMNKTRVHYFEQDDVLHLVLAEGPESRSLELSPNITVELNDQDELIGVEILHASAFLRDAVLESIQAKTLRLLTAPAA